jgi:hypothetical protein
MTLTSTPPEQRRDLRTTIAWLITEALGPVVQIVALLLVVGVHESSSAARGLTYGAIAAVFAGLIPYAIVLTGVRLGHLGDRHIYERAERPVMMLLALASVTIGLWLMYTLAAPRTVFALVAAMVVGLTTALVITIRWKGSLHTAISAGTTGHNIPHFWLNAVRIHAGGHATRCLVSDYASCTHPPKQLWARSWDSWSPI